MENEEALNHIGLMIDDDLASGSAENVNRAFDMLETLEHRPLTPQVETLCHYFKANVWAAKIQADVQRDPWLWEHPDQQEEILELRRAARHDGFDLLDGIRKCQILTNLGNQLNTVGRFIEALEVWDRALAIQPDFAMALGNKGKGLASYCRILFDRGHAVVFLRFAHEALLGAVSGSAFYESPGYEPARMDFQNDLKTVESLVDTDSIRDIDLQNFSLGRSKDERAYRTWCLDKRLFVNPLNDVGANPIAAQDVLSLPDLSVPNEPGFYRTPWVIGFFNQLKQEFVSARFLFWSAIQSDTVHFSDRDVTLLNTLEYPAHSLAVEKIRASFRGTYSVFDKIAYFLNDYLVLGQNPNRVNFRNVWFEPSGKRRRKLSDKFAKHPNWPLRGLFWLSKDFYEDAFRNVTEPDAHALSDIRNHLEHKYLQVTEDFGSEFDLHKTGDTQLVYYLSRSELIAKTLRLLKLSRTALIYLSLAVHREENLRSQDQSDGLAVPMVLGAWDDDWKR